MNENNFHYKLKSKMDKFVHDVYKVTRSFPREEIYGVTSQLRRASLSVILNYLEGYARKRKKVLKAFCEISFGSLKESEYLVKFSQDEGYLIKNEYNNIQNQIDELSAMLWGIIRNLHE